SHPCATKKKHEDRNAILSKHKQEQSKRHGCIRTLNSVSKKLMNICEVQKLTAKNGNIPQRTADDNIVPKAAATDGVQSAILWLYGSSISVLTLMFLSLMVRMMIMLTGRHKRQFRRHFTNHTCRVQNSLGVDADMQWSLDWHLSLNDEQCAHISLEGDASNAFDAHSDYGPENFRCSTDDPARLARNYSHGIPDTLWDPGRTAFCIRQPICLLRTYEGRNPHYACATGCYEDGCGP
ncbi:hypothetical protein CLF_110628, partial [Clonorchis sinensis]